MKFYLKHLILFNTLFEAESDLHLIPHKPYPKTTFSVCMEL